MPGVAGLIFPEDQAGFLAGALAALMSKSGKIGAVLGTDAVPPVWRFGEGYKAGAKYVNPDIKLNVVYHNDVGFDKTFVDPEWGKTTALSMIDKGADVIFGAGGKTGNGALLGGAEKNVYAIGVDTDQYLTVPEAQKVLLTSAMKLIIPGVFNLIKDYACWQVDGWQCDRAGRAGSLSRLGQQGPGRREGQGRRDHQDAAEWRTQDRRASSQAGAVNRSKQDYRMGRQPRVGGLFTSLRGCHSGRGERTVLPNLDSALGPARRPDN